MPPRNASCVLQRASEYLSFNLQFSQKKCKLKERYSEARWRTQLALRGGTELLLELLDLRTAPCPYTVTVEVSVMVMVLVIVSVMVLVIVCVTVLVIVSVTVMVVVAVTVSPAVVVAVTVTVVVLASSAADTVSSSLLQPCKDREAM